jgi:proteasome assembly chaperone (PAC2) family protein
MERQGLRIEHWPRLKSPVFIVGFNGWGNALNVATDLADYLIERFEGKRFGDIDPDLFFAYDKLRPTIDIQDGVLKGFDLPEGTYFAASTEEGQSDLVILKSHEPLLKWHLFTSNLFDLFSRLEGRLLVTLGSMFDNVLHTDRTISGMASSPAFRARLTDTNVALISYQGPAAIHSILQDQGTKLGFECLSLWAHCPYYLQGTSHFGLIAEMSILLARLADFSIDPSDLETRWRKLNTHIQKLIDEKPDLRNMINALRKEKVRGSLASMKDGIKKQEKVIDISDFLDPK